MNRDIRRELSEIVNDHILVEIKVLYSKNRNVVDTKCLRGLDHNEKKSEIYNVLSNGNIYDYDLIINKTFQGHNDYRVKFDLQMVVK